MLVIYKQGAINQWIIEKNLVEVIKREPLSYTSPLGVEGLSCTSHYAIGACNTNAKEGTSFL